MCIRDSIYSWYCTAPVKAALDRLVYAMDKYYGPRGKGPALLAGKPMAAVLNCGYRPEKGTDLFAEGMRRWCRHTGMRWLGSLEAVSYTHLWTVRARWRRGTEESIMLKIQHLTKTYGDKKAVDDLSLHIQAGRSTASSATTAPVRPPR